MSRMKIQYASDLHLEFPENREFLRKNPLIPEGDILLLAGDVVPFHLISLHNDFFSYVSDHFQETFWIPGNHEYYGFDVTEKGSAFHEKVLPNVHLLHNMAVARDGIRFIFSTLWGHITPDHEGPIERNMSDFHRIRDGGQRFSAASFNRLHHESLSFITSELEIESEDQTVVVTHHVPTLSHYPREYRESVLNQAFVVELFDLITGSAPDYWIYGHHHRNTPDFFIGPTRMLTNQAGYVVYGEQRTFDPAKVIEIP